MEKGQLGPNPSFSKANLDIHHKSKLDRSDGIRVEYPHIESLGVNQISWVSSSLGSCSSSSSSSLTCKEDHCSSSSSSLTCKEDHCSSTGNMSVPQNSLKNGSKTKPRRTKFLGVRQRPSGRWVAEIKDASQKLRLWLGTFDCAEDAARAYDDAARFLRGKNTRTNFAAPENSRNIQPNSSKASRLLLLRHALAKAAQNTTTVQGKALKNADICTATHLDQQSKANRNDNSNNVVIEGHGNAMTETTHDDQRWVLSSSSGDSAPYNQSHVGINCLISSADMQCSFSQNLAAVPGNGQYNAPTNGTKSINRTVVYGPRPANATSFDTFCTSGWYLQQSFNVSGNQHAVSSSECVNQSRHGKTTSSIRVAPSFNASLYSEAEKFLYRHAAAACSSESPIAANGL